MKRHLAALAAALIILGLAHQEARAATQISLTVPAPNATFTSGTLLVQRFGSGPQSIILIPGLSSGPWEFATLIGTLDTTQTVYALTLPGFDGQARIPAPMLPRVARDVWNLIATQHIEKPVILGHSLGGTLAYLLAEQHPHRLRGIISIDGLPVFPGTEALSPVQRKARAAMMKRMFAQLSPTQFQQSNLGYMTSIGTTHPHLAQQMALLADRSDPIATADFASEDLGLDLRADLAHITIPVLLISPYNAPDFSTPPYAMTAAQKTSYYRRLTSGVPHETVVTINAARHYAQLDQPEAVDAAIRSFISRLP